MVLTRKHPSPRPSPTRGEGTFLPLVGNVIELRYCAAPFRAKSLSPCCRHGPYSVSPSGLVSKKKTLSRENGGIREIFRLCHAGNSVVFWEINNVTV